MGCLSFIIGNILAQKSNYLSHFGGSNLNNGDSVVLMPYNRLIKSAGKTITYGEPSAENHSLDLSVLPGNKYIVVGHREGIVIINTKENKIVDQ